MTKRGKELDLRRKYEEALSEVERTRPEGKVYIIFSENGSQSGRVIYEPADDTLTIDIGGTRTNFKGEHLHSIYKALKDLFSEAEEAPDGQQ